MGGAAPRCRHSRMLLCRVPARCGVLCAVPAGTLPAGGVGSKPSSNPNHGSKPAVTPAGTLTSDDIGSERYEHSEVLLYKAEVLEEGKEGGSTSP